jgi:hypothetical protein
VPDARDPARGGRPAQAIPPDPPPAPLTPGDGAAVPVNANGIPVTFSCPVYRMQVVGDFTLYGGPKDYGLSMATAPATGSDGRLANPVGLTSGGTSDGADTCSSTLGAGGSQRPQETPGPYYWQVWRPCTDCDTGYDVGPVRTLVIRANASRALKAPKTVYAGYPFIASGTAEPTVALRAGTAKPRAAVVIGSETVTSPEVTVKVVRAKAWKTKARDDGSYAGTRASKLKVARKGREIRSLSVSVSMLCPTPGMVSQFTTQIGTARLARVRVAPDGSFVGTATPESSTSIRVRGTLKNRKISGGRAELSVGTCSGSAAFTAKRR